MARDLNKVQMTGRLGADPEIHRTPQGHTVATFRVASNRSWHTPDGDAREETEWFRVVAWNRLAEVCGKWLAKSSRVYVEGRLQTRQWRDQHGHDRSFTEVVASDIIILNRRSKPAAPEAGPPAASPPADEATTTLPAGGPARARRVLQLPRGKRSFEEEDLPF